jgi:hypothetical protein
MKKVTIPATAKRVPVRPVALGEATGHHHSFAALADHEKVDDLIEMYEHEGNTYVRVTGAGAALLHQEHKAHEVPAGDYAIVIQEQVTDWGTAPVRD